MTYVLHVYGGENIEETKEEFASQKKAKKEAEQISTDDTRPWETKDDGTEVLVDYNNSDKKENIVIHKVYEKP